MGPPRTLRPRVIRYEGAGRSLQMFLMSSAYVSDAGCSVGSSIMALCATTSPPVT